MNHMHMPMSNLDMMMWLRGKMDECEVEIRYLEELLVTTSGPGESIINSLNANKAMYNDFQTEYNRYVKLEEEKRKNG
jgi:hypothetical protein